MTWDRRLWGVELYSVDPKRDRRVKDRIGLLGSSWADDDDKAPIYDGEPSRCLLFVTRAAARAWCQDNHEFYASYPDGHVRRYWRFRPIRVRETVRRVRG